MVPNGWIKTTLGNLTNGSAFGPRFSSDLYLENGSVGVIRTTDLDAEGNINYSTIPYANVPESFDAHHLEEGDLLITRSGTCGIPCIFKKQAKPIVAGAFLIRFILNEKVNAAFLHALLKSKDVQVSIQNLASGGVQKNLTGTNLKKLELCIPPIPEQKKIAQILSTWDQAISATEKLLENSQQQKKVLMQQLLTGKKRLIDENGVEFSDEWQRIELGSLLDYQQPTPYLVESTAYSESYKTPVLTAGKTFILGYTNESSGIYQNQLPVIIFDDFTTDSKYVNFPFKAKSSAMKILTAKKGVSIKFVFESMQMLKFTVGGHQRHWISIFSNLVIPLPNLKEQQKIAEVLSLADQEIETLQKKLDCLKLEKKALMQQLLTGKKRVKVAA